MELTASSWFNQPRIYFKVSHKVDSFMRREIKDHIMKPLGLIEDYPGKFLHLTVTTEEDRTELEVKLGPKWSKRTKSRNHGLWFPYHKIVDSEYPLKEYLKCYMDCLPIIFIEFGVTEAQLEQVRLNCEKAILNNQEYEMTEKEINEHEEAYDLGEKFAKELGIK